MSAVAGRVLLLPKGEYNASETYHPLDFVTYGSSSYVCKATTLGNLPTDTDYWQPMAKGVESPAEVGIGIGTCSTAASTVAKTATLTDYVLTVNGFVAVTFTNAVPANSTLNINSQGAKPIYYQGSAIVDQVIRAGYTATFAYDGTNYVLISVDKSAGHEIKNHSGTTMTQRSALKFEGAVDVTDDSTNDQTKIKVYGHQIKDSSGTAMTDRTTMKFAGNVDVTDDSQNGQTIVTGKGHTVVNQGGIAQTQRNNLQFADAFITDDSGNNKTIVENIKEVSPADYASTTDEGIIVTDDGNDALIGPVSEDVVEVTADGDKTYATLLNEIYAELDFSKIRDNSYLVVDGADYAIYTLHYLTSNTAIYTYEILGSSTDRAISLTVASSSERWINNNGTITDVSSSKASNGTKITLYYGNKKATVDLQTTANRCWYDEETTVKQKIDSVHSWTKLGEKSNGESITIDLSNYSELLVATRVGSEIYNSFIIPVGVLISESSEHKFYGSLYQDTTYNAVFRIQYSSGSLYFYQESLNGWQSLRGIIYVK